MEHKSAEQLSRDTAMLFEKIDKQNESILALTLQSHRLEGNMDTLIKLTQENLSQSVSSGQCAGVHRRVDEKLKDFEEKYATKESFESLKKVMWFLLVILLGPLILILISTFLLEASTLPDQLIRHEGVVLKPYECPAGFTTVGVGRNLSSKGISYKEALFLLDNDIQESREDLKTIFPRFDAFTTPRQWALIDLRFNLGPNGFRGFKKMIEAIEKENWSLAARELKNSLWWKQVQPERRYLLYEQLNEK